MDEYKEFITPMINDCRKEVKIIQEELKGTRKIISRFDEVLLEKVNMLLECIILDLL